MVVKWQFEKNIYSERNSHLAKIANMGYLSMGYLSIFLLSLKLNLLDSVSQ